MIGAIPPFRTIKNASVSFVVCLMIALFSLGLMFTAKDYRNDQKILINDVVCYYNYLPGVFKHQSLDFEKLPLRKGYVTAPDGTVAEKMTMGLSFLYLPFYLVADLYVRATGIPYSEYDMPFRLMICLSSLFYLFAGFLLLRKLLLKYFSDGVVSLALCCLFFGTNMVYYAVYEAGMPHIYVFFLLTAFLWLVMDWHENPTWKNSILLGLLMGLLVLIRPSNVTIVFIALLWNTHNRAALQQKWQLIKRNLPRLLTLAFCGLLVWVPQMLYWHHATGQYLYYSYTNERFFFDHPRIILGLISYRNGWLLYAPVMTFSLIGMFFLRAKLKAFFWPVLVWFLLSIYLIFSWWCWWYVGCGLRTMIDLYAVLAFPLAAFIEKAFALKKYLRVPVLALVMFLMVLGLLKNYQYKKGIIHFDSMTGKAYWYALFKTEIREANYYFLLKSPDYEKASKGEE